ncbi:Uncharacterized protein TPAR_00168 [Tolypocladium paradoxum]|uniref:Uncharacterized protein n=1 Tax=Tolypocladium paradoxum TaxID=94208 RepID=A0A2S4LB32_9HYPO|nr:Uncharacterized protein TPAR_00168 [Tolypocladium paradoxum]
MELFPARDESRPVAGRATFSGDGYAMQPRINLRRNVGLELPAHVGKRTCSGNTCETNYNTSITNLAIILGIVIPVVVAVIVLIFLHRRNVRRLRMEDAKDSSGGLDFGLEDAPRKGGKRKSLMFGGEKTAHRPSQLSMDMNLSSPYLLPPGVHQSHDSIHSLARTFPNEQDPYRTVKEYINSETGSIRSFNPSKDPFGNSKRASIVTSRSIKTPMMPPPRTNSMPKSPVSPDDKINPFATPTAPAPSRQLPSPAAVQEPIRPVQPIVPETGTVSYPDDKVGGGLDMPDVLPPPAAVSRNSQTGLPEPPADHGRAEPPAHAQDSSIGVAHTGDDGFHFPPTHGTGPAGLGLDLDLPKISSPTSDHAVSTDPHALHFAPGQAHSYDDYTHQGENPQIRTSQYSDEYEEDERGRGMQRQASLEYHAQQQQQQQQQRGLGVPQQEAKRLSVGFRPLPPDEVTESEDPEYRANRIRSFYKEYFEDSSAAAPPLPTNPRGGPQYYEDYDENYLGEAAYYDADTNAFVMPYAQPVTRRAMTPPPAGRSRGGPGGPAGRGPRGPHGPHGSIGGMSLPGGPRRPRAGSAFSPRAGSAFGPRPDSSASARMRGLPRKHLPPPTDLKTLPTPSKLRDDAFALNAIDFAPPDSFREHVAGRSQSPLGERRPYQPKVPVASPLVTAFDELAALPSPHLLRKSSTFTNLDFAPPKKFKDADTMSDAGSIKSNRSGISAVQLGAIRSGAGRVSRLPGDTVFTSAALSDQLKPQWGMRP